MAAHGVGALGVAVLELRSAPTEELSDLELTEVRMLLDLAFEGNFSDEDWDHTLGGRHFIGLYEATIVAHASVVARHLHVDGRRVRTGYVEGVGVAEEHRRRGSGHSVMSQLGEYLIARFELGALSAAEPIQPFYERLGWQRWRGPTAVMVDGVAHPTPEDDGGVMILETPSTGQLDRDATLACEWREGDVW